MKKLILGSLAALTAYNLSVHADQQFLDDVIIDGSACIGQDCVNGESFGFDTIRIKENNLRIKAQDTSSTASFPTQDWQITFNDSSNGGANKFSIDAISPSASTPFTIEAGAPSHSLYVEDGGRVGFGTSTPVVDLHVKSGNTPTLRLEQDGSSGFGAQTWDVAGNEANFFIRDATNGSTLPFRIFPGAPSNSITIENTGDVGIGTTSPSADMQIVRSGQVTFGLKDSAGGTDWQMVLDPTGDNEGLSFTKVGNGVRDLRITDTGLDINKVGQVILELQDSTPVSGQNWSMIVDSTGLTEGFSITRVGSGTREFRIDNAGNIYIGAQTLAVPDFVFEPDYSLMPISELESFISREKHLPNIASAEEIKANGLNMTGMQMKLLGKIEELTLYLISQDKTVKELHDQLASLKADSDPEN